MKRALLLLALTTTACDSKSSAEQKALADARDIARVEAAQNVAPPITMLSPQPITFQDIEKNQLFGASCVFLPEGGPKDDYVILAMAGAAYLKIDGALHVYAADKGSAQLPLGNWTRYEGREHVIDLQSAGGEGTPSGEETVDWPGHLTVRDPYDRVVYNSAGTVQCGS